MGVGGGVSEPLLIMTPGTVRGILPIAGQISLMVHFQ